MRHQVHKEVIHMAGRSIRIFLVDGSTSGLRTADIGLSTVKALVVPRASLSIVGKREEVKRTGVYILVGPDPSISGGRKIYVGEGDVVLNRLAAHDKDADKEFWDEVLVFVSKDENLTKAHVRYLEARLIAMAKEAKKCVVTNGTEPPEQGKLPEHDVVEMEAFLEQVRLLAGTLGYDLLQSVSATEAGAPNTHKAVFEYVGEGFSAVCEVDPRAGRYVVKAGSKARLQDVAGLAPGYKAQRTQLVASGIWEKRPDHYRFTQDYSFSAISAAAQVVSGYSISGRVAWKLKGGSKTYAEWQDALMAKEQI